MYPDTIKQKQHMIKTINKSQTWCLSMVISHKLERGSVKDKPRAQFCHISLPSVWTQGHKRRQTLGRFICFYYWFTISLILFLNACLGPEKQERIDCQQYQILLFLFSGAAGNRARIRAVQEPSDFVQAIPSMRS